MAKCIFENLTKEQARILSDWYNYAGEQDAYEWFLNKNTPVPYTDMYRESGYREILDNGDVIVYCR